MMERDTWILREREREDALIFSFLEKLLSRPWDHSKNKMTENLDFQNRDFKARNFKNRDFNSNLSSDYLTDLVEIYKLTSFFFCTDQIDRPLSRLHEWHSHLGKKYDK